MRCSAVKNAVTLPLHLPHACRLAEESPLNFVSTVTAAAFVNAAAAAATVVPLRSHQPASGLAGACTCAGASAYDMRPDPTDESDRSERATGYTCLYICYYSAASNNW
ncbi:unnamed protein product [Hydatigera taeniaeformis]|uniref:Secreted protein n=1 Tax=Hydatigena taeniaeformis TaxID=6205 RepID=A0A0R3X3U0_HYDTA|nr:unnamed protein product [Hydatigera taeniaeformis]